MTRAHFSDSYLLDPRHPVTVNVIGAGGTGSQVVTSLARMDTALRKLGHPGLFVRVYDPDTVGESNIGRQLFSEADLGLNKAQCLVTRINRFFGNDWAAVPERYREPEDNRFANLFITCTDSKSSRLQLSKLLEAHRPGNGYTDYSTPLYWCDFGNAQKTGQVIMGTIRRNIKQPESKKFETVQRLPFVTEYVKSYARIREEESELLARGGARQTGSVRQLHAGASGVQPAVEDVPRGRRLLSRILHESRYDARQSDLRMNLLSNDI